MMNNETLRAVRLDEYTWEIMDKEHEVTLGFVDIMVAGNEEEALDYWAVRRPVNVTPDDVVNNPMHYKVGGYEAIDVIKAKLTPEEYRGYCKGNILKYVMRANYKGHHDNDCGKAEFYAKELYNALDDKTTAAARYEVEVRTDDSNVPF